MLIMVFLNGVFLIWPPFFRFRMIFSLKMVFISCVFDSRNQSIVQFGTIAMVLWCGVYVQKLQMVLWWMVPLWCFMVPGTGLVETVEYCESYRVVQDDVSYIMYLESSE